MSLLYDFTSPSLDHKPLYLHAIITHFCYLESVNTMIGSQNANEVDWQTFTHHGISEANVTLPTPHSFFASKQKKKNHILHIYIYVCV